MRLASRKPVLRFTLEILGFAVLAAAIGVIATFHLFDGFASEAARQALVFSLVVPALVAVPIHAYATVGLLRLREENRHLLLAATRDGLTQVLNRAAFQRCAQAEIAALGVAGGAALPHTLLILDADHFKRINDRLGHHVGDTALTLIAATLRRSLRRDDLVGRLGGEEFAVLLRNAGPAEAGIVAERLRATIERLAVGPEEGRAKLSVSIGGVSFRAAVGFQAVYRLADANLYKAKRGGRNRVELTRLGALGSDTVIDAAPAPRERRRLPEPPRLLH